MEALIDWGKMAKTSYSYYPQTGYYKSDCPNLKNGNQRNRAGNGNAMARAYAIGTVRTNRNSNVVTVETDDSNVIPDSPGMCDDAIQNDQNDVESDDEHVALANLIANLKLDVDKNKKIQKQLKKANTTLAQELKECKAILAETSKSLGSLLVFGIVAWLHFRTSRLSLRSIRPLMTIPLTMTNLN
nr:hypothetical protein [Tanacetum cinerariifolium]